VHRNELHRPSATSLNPRRDLGRSRDPVGSLPDAKPAPTNVHGAFAIRRRKCSPPEDSSGTTPSPSQERGNRLVIGHCPLLRVGGQSIRCRPHGWRIIELLLQSTGAACDLASIVDHVYGDDIAKTRAGNDVGSRQLQDHLRHLRRLLEPFGYSFSILHEQMFLLGPGDPRKKLFERRRSGG
jgi:hypothetical protein